MPFRLTMLAQRAIYYLAKTPSTKHENSDGQGVQKTLKITLAFAIDLAYRQQL